VKILALIAATFRELTAKATLIILASISTLIILGMMFSIGATENGDGVVITMFGNPAAPAMTRETVGQALALVQASLAGGLYVGIILFGIFATAGIMPDMLEKGTIDLYLSKPIARWELILGKYLGGVTIIFLNIVYFLGALWIVFGVKTGIWNTGILLSSLTMTLVFAALYTLTVVVAIVFRNTAVPIIASFLYLFVVGSILEAREQTLFLLSENVIFRGVLNGLYYIFPQISALKENVTHQIVGDPIAWRPVIQSVLSSMAFLGMAMFLFRRKDF
jgi:ABC-type transport system involved in multi-copper enzyme maturation permease subunit